MVEHHNVRQDANGVMTLLDLTVDDMTPNTNLINAQCRDARLRYVMS